MHKYEPHTPRSLPKSMSRLPVFPLREFASTDWGAVDATVCSGAEDGAV